MSIHWLIIRSLVRRARHVSLVDDRGQRRAIEILVGAFHVAEALRARCASGTVGVMTPTGGALPVAALAGWMLGKTVVPLNYLLKPEELQYVIDDCGTDTLVTAGPLLEHLGATPRVANLIKLDELPFSGVPDLFWPARARPDDLALLLYTSGTSGKPKGVMLSHANILANMRQILRWVDFTTSDVMLGVLPQFHTFGLTVLTLLPLAGGIKVVYSARFVPQRIVRLFREHRPTIFVAIPSMYNALLSVKDAGPEDFASLRYAVSGGEPLPRPVLERFRDRFGVTICEGYGLTETAPVTNWCRPHEFREGSVGRALPDIDQRIVDIASREELPAGRDGEVIMRGPNVMQGYYRLEEQTRAVFDESGFFLTGDMGHLDDDGHLHITGRLKEMLIIGGENVFPREIEEVLNRHAAVKDSGVIGRPDPMRGEVPVAFVELKDGQSVEPKALITWCRQSLAGYKAPDEVRIVDALPRNPTGKIVRRELKKLL